MNPRLALSICFLALLTFSCQDSSTLDNAVDEVSDAASEMGDAVGDMADAATDVASEAGDAIAGVVGGGDPRVFFEFPEDGATISSTTNFLMGHEGVKIVPAGTMEEGTGHFHILVNTDFIAPGIVIPQDEQHIHFGLAQKEAELTLPAGTHTLRLQLADGAHQGMEGDNYRDTITVTVQ